MTVYSIELEIDTLLGGGDNAVSLDVEVELSIITHSTRPSGEFGPPEFYDPGDAAEFRIDEVRVTGLKTDNTPYTLKLKPEEFEALYPYAEQILDLANDWAAENEELFNEL